MTVQLILCAVAIGVAGVTVRADQATSQGNAQIQGRVTASDDSALVGADVMAVSMASGPDSRVRTALDGTYSLSNLVAGEYRLFFSLTGFQTIVLEHVRVSSAMSLDAVMWIRPHPDSLPLSALPVKTGSLRGRVLDPARRPWAHAAITLMGGPLPAEVFGTEFSGGVWPELMTDTDGLFDFELPLPVGKYRLRVAAAGFDIEDVPIEIVYQRETTTEVTLKPRAPRRPTGAATSSLLVERTDGAWIIDPVESGGAALAALLADVDGHRFDHSLQWDGDNSYIQISVSPGRTWRWDFGQSMQAAATVRVTASDNPGQPLVFRVIDRPTTSGLPRPRRILAVSRLR